MSGGVDSSVAAALVKEAGHEPVGVWLRLSETADSYSEFKRSCCSADAADDARRVAATLGIPFYILSLEREFDEGVLRPFMAAYLAGSTPSPCVDCNSVVKFGALLGRARQLYDCEFVATGHYARVSRVGGRFRLLRGLDPQKDQSYFLYGLGQEELAHTLFPLGEMAKPKVREKARVLGLVTAAKPDSQEICFVPRGNYRDLLREKAGWRPEPGPLLDVDGRQIGEHFGTASYTVGQRQGIGVALGEPRYVWRIDASANSVQLGRRADLEVRQFTIEKTTFVAGEPPASADSSAASAGSFEAEVQIRHRGRPMSARVRPIASDRWSVETDDPVWAAAPGQAAVFYRGAEVIGGGRIVRSEASEAFPG